MSKLSHPLSTDGLHYLASPYAGFSDQRQQRINSAVAVMHELFSLDYQAFSPIAHNGVRGEYVPPMETIWKFDFNLLRKCDSLILLPLPGWRTSRGVALETGFALAKGIPMHYLVRSATGSLGFYQLRAEHFYDDEVPDFLSPNHEYL